MSKNMETAAAADQEAVLSRPLAGLVIELSVYSTYSKEDADAAKNAKTRQKREEMAGKPKSLLLACKPRNASQAAILKAMDWSDRVSYYEKYYAAQGFAPNGGEDTGPCAAKGFMLLGATFKKVTNPVDSPRRAGNGVSESDLLKALGV